MTKKKLFIILEEEAYQRAQQGKIKLIKKICDDISERSGDVELIDWANDFSFRHLTGDANILYYRAEPEKEGALTFRPTPIGPYVRIEPTTKRQQWTISKKAFDPERVDSDRAYRFANQWRNRLKTSPPQEKNSDPYIFIPLQARLLSQRDFQICSPVEMLAECATSFYNKKIYATLHPRAKYTKEEIDHLEMLEKRFKNLTIIKGNRNTVDLIAGCECVATQNSAAGFFGIIFRKPLILFAEAEYHHIAQNVKSKGLRACVEAINRSDRDIYDKYAFWFTTTDTIPIGRKNTIQSFWKRCFELGWQHPS